jgi:hypothetical protein
MIRRIRTRRELRASVRSLIVVAKVTAVVGEKNGGRR